VNAHKVARAENIESKVMRQGLLVNGEIVPPNELDKSDWLELFMHNKDNVPLAMTNESSPPASSTLQRKDSPKAPRKNSRNAEVSARTLK
jgi:hypothetical protein